MRQGVLLGLHHIRALYRANHWLVLRFAATSFGKSLAGLATILLTRDFLAGILTGTDAVNAGGAGAGVPLVLWGGAGLLLLSIDRFAIREIELWYVWLLCLRDLL
jgi:hypothetical protein